MIWTPCSSLLFDVTCAMPRPFSCPPSSSLSSPDAKAHGCHDQSNRTRRAGRHALDSGSATVNHALRSSFPLLPPCSCIQCKTCAWNAYTLLSSRASGRASHRALVAGHGLRVTDDVRWIAHRHAAAGWRGINLALIQAQRARPSLPSLVSPAHQRASPLFSFHPFLQPFLPFFLLQQCAL